MGASFHANGPEGLIDAKAPGPTPKLSPEQKEKFWTPVFQFWPRSRQHSYQAPLPSARATSPAIRGASDLPIVREKQICLLLSGIAAMIMHMGWAVGFVWRLMQGLSRGGR